MKLKVTLNLENVSVGIFEFKFASCSNVNTEPHLKTSFMSGRLGQVAGVCVMEYVASTFASFCCTDRSGRCAWYELILTS